MRLWSEGINLNRIYVKPGMNRSTPIVRGAVPRRWVTLRLAAIIITCSICSLHATLGSTVTELYVNGTTGSDSNPGTLTQPLKTLNQASALAMQNYANGIGTTIEITPGVYRESLILHATGREAGAPVVFEGSPNGPVIITGSSIWTGWTQDPSNPSLYSHPWPYRWGLCTAPKGWPSLRDIVLRREMIFLNGTLLTQVLSKKDLHAGAFIVEESSGLAYLWVPVNTNMETASIEVSTLPTLFYSDHVSHLTLRRLAFQNANSCISTSSKAAVVISNATGITVEDTSFNWNNWVGAAFYNLKNVVIQRVHGDYNGELGLAGWRLKTVTFQDVTTAFNDWRGQWGGFDTWETGGAKFLRVHGGVFTNYISIRNGGRGLWFDTDNANVVLEGSLLAHNTRNGIFIEKNEGPFTMIHSRICGNQNDGVWTNSPLVSLRDNQLFANAGAQITVMGKEGSPQDQDWETGTPYTFHPEKLTLNGNTIMGSGRQLLLDATFLSSPDANRFMNTLGSTANIWYQPDQSNVFRWDVHGSGTQTMDFSGWKSFSRQDQDSTFAPPLHNDTGVCRDTP